jgi:hypothetical protein
VVVVRRLVLGDCGGFWLAGTIAGMTFALALYQRRAIGDALWLATTKWVDLMESAPGGGRCGVSGGTT